MHSRLIIKLFTTSKRLQATTIAQTSHTNNCLSTVSGYHHAMGISGYLSTPPMPSWRFIIISNIQILDINNLIIIMEFTKWQKK